VYGFENLIHKLTWKVNKGFDGWDAEDLGFRIDRCIKIYVVLLTAKVCLD
jgi:hypothetical protein